MKEIKLTQGKVALVDDDAYDVLNRFQWYASFERGRWYAGTHTEEGGTIKMHQVIMNSMTGGIIDHIDQNGLNNQRYNLRVCTKSINQQNMRDRGKYQGVCWDRKCKKFMSNITVNYKFIFLGYYTDPEQAALKYNEAALKYFGCNAKQNVISQEKTSYHLERRY